MAQIDVNGIHLFYKDVDQDTVPLVQDAIEKTIQILEESWCLKQPAECHVYIMTSWREFIFQAAPWHWKILLFITYPFWVSRIKRTWNIAGGWAQAFGKRRTVGIKPPRLLTQADTSLGKEIFIQDDDLNLKVRNIACHELVHAFTTHLRLPHWLHEGFAMNMADLYLNRQTVRNDTLTKLQGNNFDTSKRMDPRDRPGLINHFIRGYWLTRFLIENHQDLLQEFLSQQQSHKEITEKLTTVTNLTIESSWENIDNLLISHYRTK